MTLARVIHFCKVGYSPSIGQGIAQQCPERRDTHCGPAQPIRPGEGSDLGALIGDYDLGRAELVNGLIQLLDARDGLQRVGDALGQILSHVPIHDRHEVGGSRSQSRSACPNMASRFRSGQSKMPGVGRSGESTAPRYRRA